MPGEQPRGFDYIKLNTNESPFPPPPEVIAAINCAEVEKLRLYSDPDCKYLRQALAEQYGVKAENIIVGNGSDEILSFVFMAYCDSETKVSYPDISYGFYPVYAELNGLVANPLPLRADFSVDVRQYCGVGTTVVLANPNAPTGLCLSVKDIEQIVRTNPDHVVVIDEAYIDFGGESAVLLTKEYMNLLVVQTFSKSRSLAGARLGYAIGNAALIDDLNRLRCSTNPYNINRLSLIAGQAAIDNQDYYDTNNLEIVRTRELTAKKLMALGFLLTDSKANFIFARHPMLSGQAVYEGLKARGILVRHFGNPRILDYVRISIGTLQEMEKLEKTLKEMLSL